MFLKDNLLFPKVLQHSKLSAALSGHWPDIKTNPSFASDIADLTLLVWRARPDRPNLFVGNDKVTVGAPFNNQALYQIQGISNVGQIPEQIWQISGFCVLRAVGLIQLQGLRNVLDLFRIFGGKIITSQQNTPCTFCLTNLKLGYRRTKAS